MSQLGDVKVTADGDPTPETRARFAELWKKILSFFKSNQVLQRLQFVKVVNAAIPPVAPVAAPELEPPSPAPVPQQLPHQPQCLLHLATFRHPR